nr:NAD(P)/FAD-dependent oxidoreductase [Ignatzschineria rhizosphaerae]
MVLGGGVAGIEFITRAARKDKNKQFNFILIDKNPLHIWKPMLHTFAAGSQFPSEQSIPLLTQAKRYGYLYQPGEVNDINPLEKKITLAPYRDAQNTEILPERTLHYDYLVVAIGSKSNDFNTKGVKEFSYTIDDLPAAMRFNREFTDSIIQSAILQKKHHLVIVGAGAAGVELSGEIINQILTASNYSNDNFMDYIDVTIIQADDRVVPTFKDSISEAVKHAMEKIGIRIRLSTRVSEVTKDSVILENGETLKADQVVWTAGVKAPEVLSKIKDLALSPTSQLIVNEHFQAIDDPSIFAIGDCAYVQDSPLSTTAQAASQQAIYLGNHFFKMMIQQTNIPSFKYVDKGSLVSIGTYASFGMFGRNTIFRGLEFRGLSAKIAHISLYRQHQMRLLGFFKGLSAWISDRFRKWSR